MTIALLLLVAALGLLVALLLGAVVELFRDVRQLREYSGLLDRPTPVSLGSARGRLPSDVGLPSALDSAERAIVLFLSDACASCRSIAQSLDGAVPRDLTLVLDPGVSAATADLQVRFDLGARAVIDTSRGIMSALGVNVTPLAVVVEAGRLSRGVTVPSSRQLFSLLESTRVFRPGMQASPPIGA